MSGVLNLLLATASAIKDAYFNLTTLLLNTSSTNGAQNNTFLDSSTNNFSITRNGNTTQGTFTPFSQTGWSNYLTSAGLSVPYAAALQLENTNWTIESYFNLSSASAEFCVMGSSNGGGAVPKYFMGGNWSTGFGYAANRATFFTYTGGNRFIDVPFTWEIGRWYHMAAVYTHSNTTITLYIDGVSVGSMAYGIGNVTGNVLIGRNGENGGPINGYISNFRFIVGTSLYTSDFIPRTTPLTAITNTQILTCQSNRFVDNSGNSRAVSIAAGTPSVQAFSPFAPTAAYDAAVVGGSGYFDGTGDFLSLTTTAALTLGTNSFTIEYFYYVPDTGGDGRISWGASGSPNIYLGAGALVTYTNFATSVLLTSSIACQVNAWNHIAIVRNSGTTTIYINGVSGGSVADTNNWSIGSGTFRVMSSQGSEYSSGYVSGVRIVNGTAVYTSAFTPPTTPLTAITNTALLLNFTNAGIFDSTAKNDLETAGNAQVSTTVAKWGTTSMYFDGTGDYMNGAAFSNPLRAFGTGDFTIEGWFYTSSNKTQIIVDTGTTSGSATGMQVALNSSGYPYFFIFNSTAITSSIVVSLGTWTHVAWVRSNGVAAVYVNGVSGVSTANTSNITDTGLTIGTPNDYRDGTSTYHYNGYIDDLRITKYARYTADFTPPTAAFPLQ
jgi:hypothetical protein